ncbi:MAG: transporter substrate-binding domain-containing protein [Selenomonadaceae bacterium]|nr:transporter substrate-binding domain-containing protein [Selenomonadaceae bacterium]
MRKFFAIFSALLIFSFVLAGCGENPIPKTKQIGMIRHMNASEEEFNNFAKKVSETFSLQLSSYDPIFYDNLNALLMALDSGNVSVISTYDCVARYLVAQNPKYEILVNDTLEFIDAFCFAMRESDAALKGDVDNFIEEIKADGTLDKLTKTYILGTEKNPSPVEIPHIDGADTIKVAMTGDLPPLDLVLADGQAAGFNTALIAEMSKRLKKNIQIVHVESGARASALSSGRVDLIFWAIIPISDIIPGDSDKPKGTMLSSPYYRGRIVHVALKK